jgi:benzylsuccinate CoA-transferase BbsE subunit
MAVVTEKNGPYDDIRVLDLTTELGHYAGKVLADLGADVIRVEPPDGCDTRHTGPYWHNDPDPEKSLTFFYFNTNKRSITLDLEADAGRDAFKRLVATANVVLESYSVGYLPGLGLGYEELVKVKPDLIMTSVTGFGQTGPHAHYKAPDIVGAAMSGVMTLAGFPDAPPYRLGQHGAYFNAGIQGAMGTLMAIHHWDNSGEGQYVDVSMQEALSLDQETAIQFWDMQKVVRARLGERKLMPGVGTYEAADGYIFSMVGVPGFGAPWSALAQWMSEDEASQEPVPQELLDFLAKMNLRELTAAMADAQKMEEIGAKFTKAEQLLAAFYKRRPKQELYEEGQRRRLLIGPVNTPKDVVESKQLDARGWFQDVPHNGETLRHPGPPYRLPESPWAIRRRPPRLGEHNQEILGDELGLTADALELATAHARQPAKEAVG